MHRFDAEKATGSERELKRAYNELEERVSALEGETGIEPTGTPEPDTQEEEETEETAPEGEVPLDFPHRAILERRGLLSVEDLQELSRAELVALEEIGEERADHIVEAREAL